MYVGIPPIVFPYGGAAHLIRHEETGLVVHDEAEYKRAIEFLYHHPAERRRLGRNAREFIRARHRGENVARAFDAAYSKAMQFAKRERPALFPELTPAQLFAATLGETASDFVASLCGAKADAETRIANSTTALAMGEGGIFHYRNTFPDDPFLRFWAGLVLNQQGRRDLAAVEFRAALALGLDAARVWVERGVGEACSR
jgi:hypothetical protein